MKLVTFDSDWADEFSPFGFALMTEEQYQAFQNYYSQPRTWAFGSNESFEDEVLSDKCQVKNITTEEGDVLIGLFGMKKYDWDPYISVGLFPTYELDEEDDDV